MARKTITITLYMSELIYDVENKTWLTGRSRDTGDNPEQVAHMQANADEENRNQVLRSLGNAFATLKAKLGEFLVAGGTTADDVMMSGTGALTVTLSMPSNYNPSANDSVAAGLHQYLVNMAVGEWFVITNKADASDYLSMAAANLAQVREAINKRVRPERPSVG